MSSYPIFASLAAVGLVLIYYVAVWVRLGRDPALGGIESQPAPPEGMSPAETRYLYRLGFDDHTLAAAVVGFVADGAARVETVGRKRSLHAAGGKTPLFPQEQAAHAKLFENGRSVKLSGWNYKPVREAKRVLQKDLAAEYKGTYFRNNYLWSSIGFLLALAAVLYLQFAVSRAGDPRVTDAVAAGTFFAAFVFLFAVLFLLMALNAYRLNAWFFVGIAVMFAGLGLALHIVSHYVGFDLRGVAPTVACVLIIALSIFGFGWLRSPTPTGQELRAQIAGFRDYLRSPDRGANSPELFEKLLPYAVALDSEKQWRKKFAEVADSSERAADLEYLSKRDWTDPFVYLNLYIIIFSSMMSPMIATMPR